MKIYYHPQISMRSYATNKLLIDNDAQWVKAKEVLEWMKAQGDEIVVNVPSNSVLPLTMQKYCKIMIEESGYDNVGRNRYDFPAAAINKRFEEWQPDIIWLEIPELVANYKSLPIVDKADISVLATFEHFDMRYLLRQIEGYFLADEIVFPSLALFSRFTRMSAEVLSNSRMIELSNINPVIWGNFVCEEEMLRYKSVVKTKVLDRNPNESLRIIFPSRLSDFARTKWASFVSIVGTLIKKGYYIEICNPSESEIPSFLRAYENHKQLKFHSHIMKRDAWLQVIAHSDIAVILYSFDDYYSVGAIELLAAGTKLITLPSQVLDKITRNMKGILFYLDHIIPRDILKKIELAKQTKIAKFQQRKFVDQVSGRAWAREIRLTLENTAITSRTSKDASETN